MGEAMVTERRRGALGKLFLVLFWAWQGLMLLWFAGWALQLAALPQAASGAEQAGRNAGVALGLGFLLAVWALGSAIAGAMALATRGPLVTRPLIEQERRPAAAEPRFMPGQGWRHPQT